MRPAHILLVDDEPQVLSAMRRALRDSPYDVDVAANGADALAQLDRSPTDVIVCDAHMPGMHGMQVLSAARLRHPRVVRVMLTGDPSVDNAVRAINEAGVFRYLRKPLEANLLRSCIDEALCSVPISGSELVQFDEAMTGLWMAAQPIIDVSAKCVFAYELLVRSRSTLLPRPDLLFDAAERLGRIWHLEQRILELSADVARRVPDGTSLFINLHPHTLDSPELLEPLAPFASRIVLEVTERAELHRGALDALRTLRSSGFRIAIDDLGAGYSGLTYVANLRPDVVKIDMALVQGIDTSQTHTSLVKAIVGACRELDIAVVGEGIETAATRDKLIDLDCTLHQGYFYAKPAEPFCDVALDEVCP